MQDIFFFKLLDEKECQISSFQREKEKSYKVLTKFHHLVPLNLFEVLF